MEINGKREMELLKKIGFTRVAGSPEEMKAAEILKAECEAIGVPAVIEEFEIEDADIETAALEILEPFNRSYEVTGYQCAENTPDEGLTADFVYVEDGNEADLENAAGKIVLVNGYLRVPLFKKLMKAGVAGIVTFEGDLRDRMDETDLSTRKLRRPLRTFGNVPLVNLRVKDAFDIVSRGACKAKMVLKNTTVTKKSHNVVATIPGTEKPDEIMSFGAHYDSVPFSTGVFDNGAGSVINMEVMRYFAENPPRRTLKFMWYGSEEIGLEGSWAYVKAHQDELEKHRLMINVDVGGPVLGHDMLLVLAEDKLVTFADYVLKIGSRSADVKQSIYSSDCIPFADNGIPSINFIRAGAQGASYIHNRYDQLFFLSEDALAKTTDIVLDMGKILANAKIFPVEKKVPDNMKEEVDKYLYKKEIAEAEEKK